MLKTLPKDAVWGTITTIGVLCWDLLNLWEKDIQANNYKNQSISDLGVKQTGSR